MQATTMTAAAKQFEVTIVYNGLPRQVTANPKQAVEAVLQHALNTFDIRQGRENLGLFNEAGQLLETSKSVEEAGIAPGAKLLLRPRTVGGG